MNDETIESSDTQKDPVFIDLGDGKEREIRFSMEKLRILKKKFQASLLRGAGIMGIDEDQLATLLWVGLEGPETEKPTVAQIERLIDMRDVPRLMKAVTKAWIQSSPKDPGQAIADIEDALGRLASIQQWMEEEKNRLMQAKLLES